MVETTGIQQFQDLGLASKQETQAQRSDLGQDDFLTLMVTQLRNQDPFKPMESGEFLGQIAQFGTVAGIQDLQTSFNKIAGSLQSDQVLQASSLVGRDVLVPASIGELKADAGLRGAINLPAGATDVVVGFYDGTGQLVRRIDLGTRQAGEIPFTWDGTSEDGTPVLPGLYEVRAEAFVGGANGSLETWVQSTVESVTLGAGGQGPLLNLQGLGSLGLSDVRQIR